MLCSNCGTENPEENRFCGNCAHPLELTCLNCGAANPPSMKFCGQCAPPLTETATPEPAIKTERRLVTGSGDLKLLGHFIESTRRWSPQLDAPRDYLVELAAAADGDLSVLESKERRLEEFIDAPLVPLALALMLVTAQYLPADEPKREELLNLAREIATERGWRGFTNLWERTS